MAEQVSNQGVLGDGGIKAGAYNMKLARTALRNGWPISPELRQLIIDQMEMVVRYSPKVKNQIAASKVVLAADSLNARREVADQSVPASGINVQVNGDVNVDGVGELGQIGAELRRLVQRRRVIADGRPADGGGAETAITVDAPARPADGSPPIPG